jgi:predicted small lipoprotein YifL
MIAKMAAELKTDRPIFVLAVLLFALAGCGLKGDLYFPEPQTQAEEDAVNAENSALESAEQSKGISD